MSGRSDIEHYESKDIRHILDGLISAPHTELIGHQNVLVHGDTSNTGIPTITEDVSDRFTLLAEGAALFSRLAWQDTMRNVRVFSQVAEMEPTTLLDIGVGDSAFLARWIAAQGLDTTYIGVDADGGRVRSMLEVNGSRSFVGIHHDARNRIPVAQGLIEMVTCLASMEYFIDGGGDPQVARDDLVKFFDDIHRVLVPGGVFFLSTPNRGRPNAQLQHPHTHRHEFSDEVVMDVLDRCGFTVDVRFNHRARPSAVMRLLGNDPRSFLHRRNLLDLPEALADAIVMQELTLNNPIPGDVLYVARSR